MQLSDLMKPSVIALNRMEDIHTFLDFLETRKTEERLVFFKRKSLPKDI